MDSVKIEGLEVYAGHGVYEAENKNGQLFVVDVTLYLDLRQAGETDDLTLSAHYGQVSRLINGYLREHTFQLIEAAAEHLAGISPGEFPEALPLKAQCPGRPSISKCCGHHKKRLEKGLSWDRLQYGRFQSAYGDSPDGDTGTGKHPQG